MNYMRRTLPSTNSLACFEATMRHGSVTKAAEELNMTQSAVSKRIAALEELFQRPLFIRHKKRLILAPAAKQYGIELTRILTEIEASTTRFISHNHQVGLLSIAVPPTFGSRWLIPRLNNFYENYPGIDLNMISKIKPFNFNTEPIEAAIHFGAPSWQGAKLEFLMDEQLIAVCSPDLHLELASCENEEILNHALIQHTTRPYLWKEWFQHFKIETNKSTVGPRFEYYAHIIQAAIAGIGIALLPEFLIQEELKAKKLILANNNSIKGNGSYYFAYPYEQEANPAIVSFSNWLKVNRKESKRE